MKSKGIPFYNYICPWLSTKLLIQPDYIRLKKIFVAWDNMKREIAYKITSSLITWKSRKIKIDAKNEQTFKETQKWWVRKEREKRTSNNNTKSADFCSVNLCKLAFNLVRRKRKFLQKNQTENKRDSKCKRSGGTKNHVDRLNTLHLKSNA